MCHHVAGHPERHTLKSQTLSTFGGVRFAFGVHQIAVVCSGLSVILMDDDPWLTFQLCVAEFRSDDPHKLSVKLPVVSSRFLQPSCFDIQIILLQTHPCNQGQETAER
jgi:hypothetical protein